MSSQDWESENDTYNVSKECDPGPIPSLATPSELVSQDFVRFFWTTVPTLVHDVLSNTDHDITPQGVSVSDFAEIERLLAGMPQGNTDYDIAPQGVSASEFAEIERLLAGMPQVDLNFFNNLQVSSFSSGPYDFETSIPRSSPSPTHPVHEEIPTGITSDLTRSCITLPAAPPVQLLEQQPEGDVGKENSLSVTKRKAGAVSGANKKQKHH
ncbi:hypothetical protein BDR07DRAFT_1476336 [Suillus spraguei]|nr:hypothetical protein BDR07DRAFT_1476336 [Suillus spraguei]